MKMNNNEKIENSEECWVDIQGIKLSYAQKDVLLNLNGWLSDDHIDAAQKLIGDLGTGVGGLNTVVAVTYSNKLINIPENITQAIQCHNIGHHWVVSTSITGEIVVFESMSTNLNSSLKRQLQNVYKNLQEQDGSLNVKVILQQHQKGSSDCGLFAVANAVALANGVNPCSVTWLQEKMRVHLVKCFEEQKIKMFPHIENAMQTCHSKNYIL